MGQTSPLETSSDVAGGYEYTEINDHGPELIESQGTGLPDAIPRRHHTGLGGAVDIPRTRKRSGPPSIGNNRWGRSGVKKCLRCRHWRRKVSSINLAAHDDSVYLKHKIFRVTFVKCEDLRAERRFWDQKGGKSLW